MSTALAIVGVGVRGLVTLAQLGEGLRRHAHPDLDIHLIDPWPDGGGRTWRTDQSPLLLMNGPAATVTACPGDAPAGPTLLEWCRGIASGSIAVDLPAGYREEALRTDAETYPSRALYGFYLRWVLERTIAGLPAGVRVHRHPTAVVEITEPAGGGLQLLLASGDALRVDSAVLALGWLPRRVDAPPTRADRWVPPRHPADQDLSSITSSSRVFLRGLGMNFFDTMVLLTEGRGGRFVDLGGGDLRYERSGAEPHLIAGSRRGVPFRTKPAVPPSAGVRHDALTAVLAGRAAGAPWDFADEALPAIRLDALHSYYDALVAQRADAVPAGVDRLTAALRTAGPAGFAEVLAAAVPDPADRIDLDELEDPAAGRRWDSAQEWRDWLTGHLQADLRSARTPGSPLRAAMRSIGEARPMVAPALERDGLTPASVPAFQRFMRLGASLAGGPPPVRAAQLLALREAGVLEILGPEPVLSHVGEDLVVSSRRVDAEPVRVDVLLEAHLDPPDAAGTGDPLLRSLLGSGLARPHRLEEVVTGAVEVELASGRVLRADGTPHDRLFMLGIPSEGQRVFTILSPKPGGQSPILDECRAAAAGMLATALEPVGA